MRGISKYLKIKIRSLENPYILEILLFSMVFFNGAYFYNGVNWYQIARYDAIFSFVEPGSADHLTFHIDHFITDPVNGLNTADWANNPDHDNHFYANKAPGPILFGIPLYSFLYWFQRQSGIIPEMPQWTVINCYLLNVLLSVLPAALSSIFFFRIILRQGPNNRIWALTLTCGLYFSTLFFPYSTSLWGHITAASLMIIGLYFFLLDTSKSYLYSGLFLGLSVLCDYSISLTLIILLTSLVLRRKIKGLLFVGLGGMLPFFVFTAYHKICFGHYITTALFHNNPRLLYSGYIGGLIGSNTILAALKGITFSPYRGLFWYVPLTLVLLCTGLILIRFLNKRVIYWISIANIMTYLLFNSIYNFWDGGSGIGPRFQIPALPFYVLVGCLAINFLPHSKIRKCIAMAIGLTIIVSFSNMFVSTAVSPFAKQFIPGRSEAWKNPLPRYYQILFRYRDMHIYGGGKIRDFNVGHLPRAFNLGQLTGLTGLWPILPWASIMGLFGFLLVKQSSTRASVTDRSRKIDLPI